MIKSNKGRIVSPYGFVSGLVAESKSVFTDEDVGEEAAPLEEDAALLPTDKGNEETEDYIEAMLLLNGYGAEILYQTGTL